jgi:DNA polymerase elongation subunit (family B)
VSINTRESKPNIFRLNSTRGKFRKNPTAIKKIIDLGYNDEDEFVYDIETTRGRFFAGVGRLILKNTDSEYVFFPHLHDSSKSRSENAAVLWDHCLKVAAEVTKLYPAPMKLEFEEEIYHRFLILSKKRYMYRTMKREGIVKNKVGNKGVLLSRRDNSNVVRDVYAGLVERVFDRKPESEILDWLMDKILEMFHRKVDADKFTITKAVGGVGNLPLINEVNIQWIKRIESGEENQSTEVLEKLEQGKVVVGDYTIPILSKEPVERARQMKMKEASNPIEYYTHCLPAHVALAMKMKSRGTRVDDGTRLEHLVTVGNGHKGKLFSKVEDVNYYKRHSAYLKIDKLYYLKAMTRPIDQVLRACFGMKYFMKNLYKHWLNREKVLESLVAKPNIIFE